MNKMKCTAEFLRNLQEVLKEAFPETYGGPYGPGLNIWETVGYTSAYDLNWRDYMEEELPEPDTPMVTVKTGCNNVRGTGVHQRKTRQWITNLRVIERRCCDEEFTGSDTCPKCKKEVPIHPDMLHAGMTKNFYSK